MSDLKTIDRKLDELLGRQAAGELRFLPIPAAAAYAGISNESIRRMLASRRLTTFRPVRGRIVVDRHELEAVVLESGSDSTDSQPSKDSTAGSEGSGETCI